ncbi:sensor histidine kinase [Myxococcota bacterium]
MTATDPKLTSRVIGWQVAFTLLVAALVAWLGPRLLLLSGAVEEAATRSLLMAIGGGGVVAWLTSWLTVRRHRFVLRALVLGSRVEPAQVQALNADILRLTLAWVAPPLAALVATATVFRPALMDVTTARSVALFGVVLVVTSSLPLHVLLRAAFLGAIELADPVMMGELVGQTGAGWTLRNSLALRLAVASVMPSVFVAMGTSLIASAHLARADDSQREETARALARAALESQPGELTGAGLEDALARAAELGFPAAVSPEGHEYGIERIADGAVELTAPLDQGSASVRISASGVPVLTPQSLLLAILVALTSGLLGVLLGRQLGRDVDMATAGVRELSEGEPALHVRSLRHVRFRAVAELGDAIERLAARFRVFERAQQQSIESREAATRARGLFFASVSHDLKSPLNAILGFTELVRQHEPLNRWQLESLDLVDRRARELLALIETILDAARVEAGQLVLVRDSVSVERLFSEAAAKGRDLGGDSLFEAQYGVDPGMPELQVDWVRMSRALATFVGHALRTAQNGPVELLHRDIREGCIELEIRVPGQQSDDPLDRLLTGRQSSSMIEQRGLALGLGLARSVIELHGGKVMAEDRGPEGRSFVVRLPVGGWV